MVVCRIFWEDLCGIYGGLIEVGLAEVEDEGCFLTIYSGPL